MTDKALGELTMKLRLDTSELENAADSLRTLNNKTAASASYSVPYEKIHGLEIRLRKPTFQEKVGAALFIMAFTPEKAGIRTLAELMWPHKKFTDEQVRKEAAAFMSDVHTALLKALPQTQIEQILRDQDERLSFALE